MKNAKKLPSNLWKALLKTTRCIHFVLKQIFSNAQQIKEVVSKTA